MEKHDKECNACNTGSHGIPTASGGNIYFVCETCGFGMFAMNHKELREMVVQLRGENAAQKKALDGVQRVAKKNNYVAVLNEIDGVV